MKTTVKIAGLAVPLVLSAVTAQGAAVTYTPSSASVQLQTATTGSYILAAFSFGLSRGTGLAYQDNGANVTAQAGNQKGTIVFGANTSGGGVSACLGVSVSTTNGFSGSGPTANSNGCS
jgi:hypothetical protein